jgi:proline iminopeptidase
MEKPISKSLGRAICAAAGVVFTRLILLVLCTLVISVVSAYGQKTTVPAIAHPQGDYATVNGTKLWFESEGEGEPLLLIAGGPGFSHSYFHPYFSTLAGSFRVIYFDAFGRGKSDRAKNPAEYTFDRDVQDVEGLRVALGLGKINVLGHSYGGMVAEAYALRFPASVHKLILSNTLFSAEMWQANNDSWNAQIRNQFPEVWEKLAALRHRGVPSCHQEYQDAENKIPVVLLLGFYDATLIDKLMQSIEDPQSVDVYCSIAGEDADMLVGGYIARLDFRKRLPDLHMPVLILAGRFDRAAMPSFSLQFKRYAPQARFVLLEKSGHFPFVEEPESVFGEIRDFLQK